MTTDGKFRPWHQLTEREQAVWGAAYAGSPCSGLEAAEHAERVTRTLNVVEWPETESPEYKAARLCRGLTRDEFGVWYQVELRMNSPGRWRRPATDQQIDEAYSIYVQCGSDFY